MKNLGDVIIKPIISEKSFGEAKSNKYTFMVAKNADKIGVKDAVEKLFKVKVKKVYTSVMKGTKTRFTRRGRQNIDLSYKKARVLLEKGQKIDIFEEKTAEKK